MMKQGGWRDHISSDMVAGLTIALRRANVVAGLTKYWRRAEMVAGLTDALRRANVVAGLTKGWRRATNVYFAGEDETD